MMVTSRDGEPAEDEGRTRYPGTAPKDRGDRDASGLGAGGGPLAVVVPVTGPIQVVAMQRDVVAMARCEISCRAVERLWLGATLISGGLEMWGDKDGLITRAPVNTRATAVVLAALDVLRPPRGRGPRQLLVGTALFCAPTDEPDEPDGSRVALGLGLSMDDAELVALTATTLGRRLAARRAVRWPLRARRG